MIAVRAIKVIGYCQLERPSHSLDELEEDTVVSILVQGEVIHPAPGYDMADGLVLTAPSAPPGSLRTLCRYALVWVTPSCIAITVLSVLACSLPSLSHTCCVAFRSTCGLLRVCTVDELPIPGLPERVLLSSLVASLGVDRVQPVFAHHLSCLCVKGVLPFCPQFTFKL